MKYLKPFYILFITTNFIASCEKEKAPIPAASLNVINTSPDIPNAKVSTPKTGYYSQLIGVNSGSNFVFTLPAGSPSIVITNGNDTIKPLYNSALTAGFGQVFSLYIAGSEGNDIFLKQDTIPVRMDSSVGIRFVNLLPGSSPVSVNILGSPNGSEISNLSYKDFSGFKSYPADNNVISTGYYFEFRNAISGDLLTTFNTIDYFHPAVPVFKNITIILFGSPGSELSMGVKNF